MRSMWLARSGLCLALLGAVATGSLGCGDGGGEQDGAPSYVGQTSTALVTAAKGGKLEAGAVKVSIPPGAVSKDVEITLEIKDKKGLPSKGDIALDVYEFGPSMQFEKAVDLEFDLTGVKVPKNKRAAVAYYDEQADKWSLLTSKESGKKITGSTTHFSKFSVIFVLTASGDDTQVGGECGADYQACGGDLAGTWTYTAACVTAPDGILGGDGENPFANCKDQPYVDFELDLNGTITFAGDGTFSVNQTSSASGGLYVPLTCLAELGAAAGEPLSCAEFGGTEMGAHCVQSEDPEPPQTEMSTGTYTVEGSRLTLTTEGSTEADNSEFCVTGSTLTVRVTSSEDGTVSQYTATRQ